jgi:hypothetical protein
MQDFPAPARNHRNLAGTCEIPYSFAGFLLESFAGKEQEQEFLAGHFFTDDMVRIISTFSWRIHPVYWTGTVVGMELAVRAVRSVTPTSILLVSDDFSGRFCLLVLQLD